MNIRLAGKCDRNEFIFLSEIMKVDYAIRVQVHKVIPIDIKFAIKSL